MNEKDVILIVDDDPGLRKTLSDILKTRGYKPLVASEGKEALETVDKIKPAVALIDIKMEGMSGLEVMEKIKQRSTETACIVLTGFGSRETAIEAVKLGAYSYIEKPYNVEQLLHTIHRAVEKQKAEVALRESEEQYRNLFKGMPIGLYRTSVDGRIMDTNPAMVEMLGYPDQESLLEISVIDLYANPEERKLGQALLEQEGIMRGFEIQLRKRDGTTIWVEDTARIIRDADGQVLYYDGSLVNITERKSSDEQIRRQIQHLKALRQIDLAITSYELDPSFTFSVLVNQLTTQFKIDAADILILNRDNRTLYYAAGSGFIVEDREDICIPLGEGYAGRAALDRVMIKIPDLSKVEDSLNQMPFLEEEKLVSYYAVPILSKGTVLGILEVFHRSPLNLDQEWFNFLESLASQAAIAIDNAKMFYEMNRSDDEREQAYEATLKGWVHALDLRDRETHGHTQRVTDITENLAREMGFSVAELIHVRRGALLHDIGKMSISDSILNKPGPLTEDEWVTMREHPTYAYNMLSKYKYLQRALDIPYCHHEKWDGTGYPRGLKGKGIPLAARIFAVVDVWDALRSDRPYRPAWEDEKALEYIREQAGKHFDAEVVESFLKMIMQPSEVQMASSQ